MNNTKITMTEVIQNIKDGDVLGFESYNIMSCIIRFFTGGKVSHVGKVYEVEKKELFCHFYFSEQTLKHGGKYSRKSIYLNEKDGNYHKNAFRISGMKKKKIIYYGQLKKSLTLGDIARGILDAKKQVGKKYSIPTFIFAADLFEKLTPKFLKKYLRKLKWIRRKDVGRICSTHCVINDLHNGSITKKEYMDDLFVTPKEYLEMKHLNTFVIK